MSHEQDEITVDLKDITPGPEHLKQLGAKLHVWRAIASHVISGVLVVGVVLSIILYVVLLCKYPQQNEGIHAAFEKWYALVGPFAYIAVGAYFGSSMSKQKG